MTSTTDSNSASGTPGEIDVVASNELRPNQIGLWHCLAQSMTHMAPGAAIAFALTVTIIFAGAAAPLSFVLGMIGALLVAYCVMQLVRHMPSAGYYMSYIGQSMGKEAGFLAAWAIIAAEVIIPSILYLLLAPVLNGVLSSEWGFTLPWWICVLILAALVTGLTLVGVRISTNVAIGLGAIEIIVFLGVSISLIVQAGSANTLSIISTHAPGVLNGWSGIFKGMVFAMAAFLGFETAAPLAEETSNPRRNVPLAIFIATLGIGLLFVVASYAAVIGWGPHNLASYVTNADPWQVLGKKVWGIGWVIVFIALLNSILGNAMAGQNGGSRVVYALGRSSVLPRVFSRLDRRHGSPYVAILAMTALNLVLALGAGALWGDFPGFTVLVTLSTLFFISLYIFACLSVPIYYLRRQRQEFNAVKHLLIPLCGAVLFVFPLYYTVHPMPAYPISVAPWAAIVWVVIGVVVMLALRVRRPAALLDATLVHLHAEESS